MGAVGGIGGGGVLVIAAAGRSPGAAIAALDDPGADGGAGDGPAAG